jgi:hypothetical protein
VAAAEPSGVPPLGACPRNGGDVRLAAHVVGAHLAAQDIAHVPYGEVGGLLAAVFDQARLWLGRLREGAAEGAHDVPGATPDPRVGMCQVEVSVPAVPVGPDPLVGERDAQLPRQRPHSRERLERTEVVAWAPDAELQPHGRGQPLEQGRAGTHQDVAVTGGEHVGREGHVVAPVRARVGQGVGWVASEDVAPEVDGRDHVCVMDGPRVSGGLVLPVRQGGEPHVVETVEGTRAHRRLPPSALLSAALLRRRRKSSLSITSAAEPAETWRRAMVSLG